MTAAYRYLSQDRLLHPQVGKKRIVLGQEELIIPKLAEKDEGMNEIPDLEIVFKATCFPRVWKVSRPK